jgi:hypothetical protein
MSRAYAQNIDHNDSIEYKHKRGSVHFELIVE